MNIKEAKKLANQLEADLSMLILKFEKQTGTVVDQVILTHFCGMQNRPESSYVKIKVSF